MPVIRVPWLWASTLPRDGTGHLRLCWALATMYDAMHIISLSLSPLITGLKTTAIDIWSLGCILAELLGRTPIFKGQKYAVKASPKFFSNFPVSSYSDQLNQVLHYVGTPSEDTLRRMSSSRVRLEHVPYKSSLLTLFKLWTGSRIYSITSLQA